MRNEGEWTNGIWDAENDYRKRVFEVVKSRNEYIEELCGKAIGADEEERNKRLKAAVDFVLDYAHAPRFMAPQTNKICNDELSMALISDPMQCATGRGVMKGITQPFIDELIAPICPEGSCLALSALEDETNAAPPPLQQEAAPPPLQLEAAPPPLQKEEAS